MGSLQRKKERKKERKKISIIEIPNDKKVFYLIKGVILSFLV
jgi:hypothetical protein